MTEREDVVLLELPASPELVTLARLVAAALAGRAGFDYEQVEDLRLAIDELCFSLVGHDGLPARVRLRFSLDDGSIRVEGELQAEPGGEVPSHDGTGDTLSEGFSAQLLDALVDEHGSSEGEARGRHVWLRKRVAETKG